ALLLVSNEVRHVEPGPVDRRLAQGVTQQLDVHLAVEVRERRALLAVQEGHARDGRLDPDVRGAVVGDAIAALGRVAGIDRVATHETRVSLLVRALDGVAVADVVEVAHAGGGTARGSGVLEEGPARRAVARAEAAIGTRVAGVGITRSGGGEGAQQ